ncbi:thiamine phosphate synthase [Parapedobacter lycopersici]|uniref:thiamine phosphate synthase n=1 Tax=Parapedobacter lycopersici TaxID=1864939 RepID=UPI00214DBFED|nr:thiamine phosphate synthase [Parapedobacter lycopersici]
MKKDVKDGVYLVIDPAMERGPLFEKLRQVPLGNLTAVQLWDNFGPNGVDDTLVAEVAALCLPYGVPLLMNNHWEYTHYTGVDGVHFDEIPTDFDTIQSQMCPTAIVGITCNNDLTVVRWASAHQLDYISFCSMFPSATANSCDRVTFETVKEARTLTTLPLFLSGGITPDNIAKLNELDYSGVAVVSGILSAAQPAESLRAYHQKLNRR